MRIKEFFIKRYGPLQDRSYTLSHPFNLLVGKNEDGKTLTVDALVKFLLGRQVKDFGRIIDRVEESPEGYVVIDGGNGKEIKLPGKGDLANVAAITPSEYRNIFIIRDSDLSIARESEFYTTVTNRLTGLRTEEILATKEALREIGRITPSGMFRDIKDEAVKTRLEGAQGLMEAVDALAHEMEEKNFDALEAHAVRLQEEREEIEHELERLDDARKRETYEKGMEAITRLTTSLEREKQLQGYHEADAHAWRDSERDIQYRGEEQTKLTATLLDHEKELKETAKLLKEKAREFRIVEDRKRTIDAVKAELNLLETKQGEGAERRYEGIISARMGMISAVLLAISLLGLIVRPSTPFYIAALLFFVTTLAIVLLQLGQARAEARLAGGLATIKKTLAKFTMSADTVEEIYAQLQRFDERYRSSTDELQEITRKKENLEQGIVALRTKAIPDVEKKIKEVHERIDDIRRRSGADSWQAYQEGLKSRQQHAQSAREAQGILRNLVGSRGETIKDAMAFWQQALKALERYQGTSSGVAYEEGAITRLKDAKHTAEAGLAAVHEEMAALRRRLEEIEREANKILPSEAEYLHCTTSVDVGAVRDRLHEFIRAHERTRDTVLKVIDIFEDMEATEREKVAELFGEQSPVSRYFGEITDGLYETVLFNREQGCIEVRRKDGALLEAAQLSGGAYDQLYLAIRLTLAEKVLEGEKGFFIMDDPFVKADPARLERQLAMLCRIAEQGWQIIYFSAKGEVKEALKRQIRAGEVHYAEIQGIFS